VRAARREAGQGAVDEEVEQPVIRCGTPSCGAGILGHVPDQQVPPAVEGGWTWDPTLYAGSAAYYAAGRVPYPPQIATALVAALGLDGSGRLLDVGCGPGSLTLLLAPYVAQAIGVDADADMLTKATRLARKQHVTNATWRHLRAEDLPADLPHIDVVTFAQSFHWMDRDRVAAAVRALLVPGGAVVHVHATTHQGTDTGGRLDHPQPPWAAITDLVRHYLGRQRRAGQGVLPGGTLGGEEAIYRAAGFVGPERVSVPGATVTRTAEQVLASVHSLSSAAPHLFGDRVGQFDADLRQLLARASSNGQYSEQMGAIDLDIWR